MFSSTEAILELVVDGALLGAIPGLVIGAIAWTITQRGGEALMWMLIGGILGLFLGLFIEGGALMSAFGLGDELITGGTDEARSLAFVAVLRLLQWILGGVAVGGAVTSPGRAILGAVTGTVVGTLSGVLLLIANAELSINLTGPVLSFGVVIVALIIILMTSLGFSE